jgi:hypothetical protein
MLPAEEVMAFVQMPFRLLWSKMEDEKSTPSSVSFVEGVAFRSETEKES